MQLLQEGTTIYTVNREEVFVGPKLGEGGQGIVHHCTFRGEAMAVKRWKEGGTTPEQRRELALNCELPSPSPIFSWPKQMVDGGYVMPLAGDEHSITLAERMFGQCNATYGSLTTAGIHVCNGLIRLHASGRAFCDLNSANIIFNPRTGQVWIVDLDNAVRDGMDVGIAFTFGAASPSLVLGTERPCTNSDVYSLAAILFMLLCGASPLEGKRAAALLAPSIDDLIRIHGTNPLFSMHPTDTRNRPDPVEHASVEPSFNELPSSIQSMFVHSFTAGLKDSSERIRETEWRNAMIELRDSIVICTKCGAHVFTEPQGSKPCWSCGREIKRKKELVVNNKRLVVNKGGSLFPHHVDERRAGDIAKPEGRIIAHPKQPQALGLKNVSDAAWFLMLPDGSTRRIDPNSTAPLGRGNRISIRNAEALVA